MTGVLAVVVGDDGWSVDWRRGHGRRHGGCNSKGGGGRRGFLEGQPQVSVNGLSLVPDSSIANAAHKAKHESNTNRNNEAILFVQKLSPVEGSK